MLTKTDISTMQSMYSFVRENNEKDWKHTKLIYFGKKINAEKAFAAIDSVATYLYKSGVQKGDSVVICLPNIPQAIYAFYAINKIGAIANIVHPKIGSKALLKIVQETHTKWAFLYSGALLTVGWDLKKSGVHVINCRIGQYMSGMYKLFYHGEKLAFPFQTVDFKDTLLPAEEIIVPVEGKDAAVYLHSSGTTGEPKTVVLSNFALNELVARGCLYGGGGCGMGEDDASVMLLPLFHGFGLGICMHYMMFAGINILLPAFDAASAVKMIRKYKVSMLCCVPSMLRRMYHQSGFAGDHLKNMKAVFIGGDKLDDKLRDDVESLFARFDSKALVHEGFGLSEVSSCTHMNMLHKTDGTVGQPLPNIQAKIVSPDGTECPYGTEGELYIAGTTMMNGYLNQETPFVTDENGTVWFPTGDFGYITEDGSLYYRGRLKRLIKIGGVNIFPQEVETVACGMKEIKSACAIRVKTEGKPALKLLVVLEDGYFMNILLKQKIKDTIRESILPYAVPREIEAVPSIRLNGMGKCDYHAYEEEAAQQEPVKPKVVPQKVTEGSGR